MSNELNNELETQETGFNLEDILAEFSSYSPPEEESYEPSGWTASNYGFDPEPEEVQNDDEAVKIIDEEPESETAPDPETESDEKPEF